MEMTDARQYLRSFRIKESQIQLKLQQIQRLKDRLLSTSATMDQEQVSHTTNVSIMADTITMIVDMQKEADMQASELLKERWKAMGFMEQIKPESSAILTARYFEGKTFPEIGKEKFITERQAQRKEREAIREFQRVLDRNEPIEAR